MISFRVYFVLVFIIGVLAAPLSATAQIGLQDPGFSYVDVNNDGVYNPAAGDIGLLTGVDIDTLIQNDGHFDTSQSEGNYHAPYYPASLVVSHAQLFTPGLSVSLRAGVNLILFANRPDTTAPTVTLTACRNIYMAGTLNGFGTKMTVNAGLDATVDGTQFQSTDAASSLYIIAARDISARPYVQSGTGIVVPTDISDGNLVSLCSGDDTFIDGANIATQTQGATVSLVAGTDLEAVDGTNISTNAGYITADSRCGLVRLQNDHVFGQTLDVDAYDAALVDGSLFITTGATSIQANGAVDGLSLIASASAFTVCSYDAVDLDSSDIATSGGNINVTGQSDVTANSANWNSSANICVTSNCGDIYVRTATLIADPLGSVRLYAGGGLIDVTGSFIFPFPSYGPNNVTVIGALRLTQ